MNQKPLKTKQLNKKSSHFQRSLLKKVAVIITASLSIGCATIYEASTTHEDVDSNRGYRTAGSFLEDQTIEGKIIANLRKADEAFLAAHVVAVSFNGVVLLVGQVPNDALKQKAQGIAANARRVRMVSNELEIGAPSSLKTRMTDSWITTAVKSKMLATSNFPSTRVKIVTENSIVYIMGLLSAQEANWAARLAQQIPQVKKIVKITEKIH